MVLFKSTMIAQASGSLAGATFSRNKGGAYIRSRVRGTNPNSVSQTRARTALSSFASLWATLTSSQQNSWQAYAEMAPFFNALGDPITPSGISVYIASNTLLDLAGLAAVTDAPVSLTRPSVELTEAALGTYTVDTSVVVTGATVTNGVGAIGVFFSSQALTAGQKSFKQRYRFLARSTAMTQLTFASLNAQRFVYEDSNLFKGRIRMVRPDGAFSEFAYINASAEV